MYNHLMKYRGKKRGIAKKRKIKPRYLMRANIPRRSTGFMPDKYYCVHRYAEWENVTTTIAPSPVLHQIYLNANSPRDPYALSGGKYAMGFPLMSQMYKRYRVLGAKLTVKVAPSTYTSAPSYWCGITTLTDGWASVPTRDDFNSQRYHKQRIAGPGSAPPIEMSLYVPLHNIYGCTKEIVRTDDQCASLINTDPVRKGYFFIGVQALDDTQVWVGTVNFTVDYYTVWEQPIAMTENLF